MYVEAFTNRTFLLARGSRFAPGDPSYAPGDELELCYAAERPDLADLAPEEVAQAVYGTLNPTDREEPQGLAFPSLSMGDVGSCRDGDSEWSLAVELMGFAQVSPPVFAPPDEHARYRLKLGGRPPAPRRS